MGLRMTLRGVDHLAIGTSDMAASVRFYVGVLGFELVNAMRVLPPIEGGAGLVAVHDRSSAVDFRRPPGAPNFTDIRHYVLNVGNDTLLGLFEYPVGTPQADRDTVAGLQHIAFHADGDAFQQTQEALRKHGIDFIGPFALPDGHVTINFFDPCGVRLEVVTDIDADSYSSVELVRASLAELHQELTDLLGDELEAGRLLSGEGT